MMRPSRVQRAGGSLDGKYHGTPTALPPALPLPPAAPQGSCVCCSCGGGSRRPRSRMLRMCCRLGGCCKIRCAHSTRKRPQSTELVCLGILYSTRGSSLKGGASTPQCCARPRRVHSCCSCCASSAKTHFCPLPPKESRYSTHAAHPLPSPLQLRRAPGMTPSPFESASVAEAPPPMRVSTSSGVPPSVCSQAHSRAKATTASDQCSRALSCTGTKIRSLRKRSTFFNQRSSRPLPATGAPPLRAAARLAALVVSRALESQKLLNTCTRSAAALLASSHSAWRSAKSTSVSLRKCAPCSRSMSDSVTSTCRSVAAPVG
mmetsp:Transcript_42802/g.105495  ORF Transcript_42802/g.105495 Transcript_42802/m.105495 type:complete len:318 (+) Transcript_42802:188-1141(+)